MLKQIHTAKEPKEPAVELAVGAVLDGSTNPLDMDMRVIGESPTDLDLDDGQDVEMHLNRRCIHHTQDACIICGQPVCDDCACDGCQER